MGWSGLCVYDAFNRRIERKADENGAASGGQNAEYYFYDGDNVILDAVDTDAGGQAFLPAPVRRYLWNPTAVDQLLAQENLPSTGTPTADDMFWILGDRQQSVGDAINVSRNVQIHNDYDAFGKTYQSQPDFADGSADIPRYGYTCQEQEPMFAGLMYYNRRWYDTGTGKFLTEDPSGFSAGDPNLYCYCGNNVTNLTDPTGYCGYSGMNNSFYDYWGANGVSSTSNYLQSFISPSPSIFAPSGLSFSNSGVSLPSAYVSSSPSTSNIQKLQFAGSTPTWNSSNVSNYIQTNYNRADWETGLLDTMDTARNMGMQMSWSLFSDRKAPLNKVEINLINQGTFTLSS
jgi:RHS repeat-associated protein